MKIGLVDVDSKIPNLALMKISAYHKQQGDRVEWYSPLFKYDQVYASQIFLDPVMRYYPINAIVGGTGSGVNTTLFPEIEHIYPDYSLYKIDYAMGFVSRGCINHCTFCVVPKKEGKLRFNAPIEEFWQGQKEIMLLDNAITDCREAWGELEKIRDRKLVLNLCQGFNVRTITPECAEILAKIKPKTQWHIAWDNIHEEERVFAGVKILNNAGIKNWKIMCYILVNFNTTLEQDLYRVQKLIKIGIDPFIMIYNRATAARTYQRLGKWCNRPQLRGSVKFEEFCKI